MKKSSESLALPTPLHPAVELVWQDDPGQVEAVEQIQFPRVVAFADQFDNLDEFFEIDLLIVVDVHQPKRPLRQRHLA